MKILVYVIHGIRFLTEMVSLFIFIYFGLKFLFPLNLLLGIAVPLLVLVIWGKFVAPKATFKIHLGLKFLIEFCIFALAFFYWHSFVLDRLPYFFIVLAFVISVLSKICDRFYLESNSHD